MCVCVCVWLVHMLYTGGVAGAYGCISNGREVKGRQFIIGLTISYRTLIKASIERNS